MNAGSVGLCLLLWLVGFAVVWAIVRGGNQRED